jgi:protocatechuate 3,4-dioxygenase, beta subunit
MMSSALTPLSRRQLLRAPIALGGLSLSPRIIAAQAQTLLKRTPEQVLGPFYPVIRTLDRGADLAKIPGKPGRAQGQVIHLMGRVLTPQGEPVSGAKVEIWQANMHGRYVHPSDTNPAPLDPSFEGHGVQLTDSEGRFRFRTIKPGAYPTGVGDWIRPPHIHFDVSGQVSRLVTQMYFEGEALNDKDQIRQSAGCKERLTAKLAPPTKDLEPDSLIAVWDIVLRRG